MASELEPLLACPRCDAPLQDLRCGACRVDFPERDGVAWLFADPQATMTEWRNRWQMALARLAQQADQAKAAAKRADSDLARQRLNKLVDGCARQRSLLADRLQSLRLSDSANLETLLALRTRLPTHQGLTTYEGNLFRDWCWGDEENRASLAEVHAALGHHRPQRMLVLGAGAGRLAYDLHQRMRPSVTIALDNNPLFAGTLARIADGESVTLVEFPLAPASADAVAIERTLQAPEPAAPNFHVILADGLRAPFRSGAFDTVITPWFLDVVAEPPAQVVPRLNRLLSDGGVWLNHGSQAFSHADPAHCLSLAELIELAEQSGYAEVTTHESELPYLNCPDSRHGRLERVVTLRASKRRDVKQPPRHQSLPEWIVSGRAPVPVLPAFQSQALSTRVHAFIMSLIDGKRSLKDMARVMEEQRLMPAADAEPAIRGFLIKMLDEASHGQRY